MEQTAHTPGPWRAKERDSSDGHTIFRDVEYVAGASTATYRIATVWYPNSGVGAVGAAEREANARLIAAAPELLEALRAAYSDIQRLPGYTIDMLGRIESAITKATQP